MDSRQSRRWLRHLSVALTVLVAGAANAAPTRSWTVVPLPSTEFGGSARAVNNRGDVVGTGEVSQYRPHPFLWRNGTATDLIAGDPLHGVANAINDQGMVAATRGKAVIAWKDGVETPLHIAGEPSDINKSGAIVGGYYPWGEIAFGPQEAFYWKDGVLHTLPSLGNRLTVAGGVNDHGVVVGYSRLPFSSDDHAIVWENGVLRDLGTLGGRNSSAGDITNHGVILGSADDAAGMNHMVTWDLRTGRITDYGPRLAGYAINDRGAIVGNQLDTGRPFLLEDGQYTWLLELREMRDQGWTSFGAFDINDRGWIVGIAWKPGISTSGTPLLLIPGNGGGGRPKG